MNKNDLKKHYDAKYEDFDNFLIDLGVNVKHLDYIKDVQIKKNIYPREYYDFINQEHNVIIPTRKIKHTSLYGNYGYYWYDLIKDCFTKEPKNITANINQERIWDCFKHLYEKGFEKWNESYLSKPVGGCDYEAFITSDEQIHYVHSGGNDGGRHRLFSAKVGGVENILAESLKIYRYNPLKARLFNEIQTKEIEIKNYISSKEYFLFDENRFEIKIKCLNPYFNYELGTIFEDKLDKKTSFLNDELDEIQSYIDNLERYKCYFKQIDTIYESIRNHRDIWPVFYIKNKLNKINSKRDRHKLKSLSHYDELYIPDGSVAKLNL